MNRHREIRKIQRFWRKEAEIVSEHKPNARDRGTRQPAERTPHPLMNQNPKGCGTQERLATARVLHPPARWGRGEEGAAVLRPYQG